jgi:hypothetical protein
MDEKLTKSLTDLIDETLMELDELRKSKFAAAEIKIEGPGEGIAGKPSDGKLDAAKAEDKKDDDKEKEEDKAEKGENESAAKGENEEAAKAEDDKKEDKKDDKKEDKKEDKSDHKKDEKPAMPDLKKSFEESEALIKSYVEERVKPLEDKLSTILDLVNKIAEQPVAPKGATARGPAPLAKSEGEGSEPLNKAQVANKLFELKKSGTRVDSLDIAKAEMGQDLQQIAKKYEIS